MPDCPASGQSCPASGQSGTAVKKTGKSHRTRLHTLKQLRFNTFISFSDYFHPLVQNHLLLAQVLKDTKQGKMYEKNQTNDNYLETKTKHRAEKNIPKEFK
jgi:hypothetical protein